MGCGATFVYCRAMYCKSERERAKNLGRMTGNEWERKNVRNRMRTKVKLTKKEKREKKGNDRKCKFWGTKVDLRCTKIKMKERKTD